MKTFLVLFTLVAARAQVAQPRSFDMVLTGINGQPPPAATSLAFRQMIGRLVSNQDVARYWLLAPPPSGGGFHVCIQAQEPKGYNDIVNALQPLSAGTAAHWDVSLVQTCEPTVSP